MPPGPLTLLFGHVLFGAVPALLKLGLRGGVGAASAVVLRFVVALGLVAVLVALGRAWGSSRGELALRASNRRGLFWRGVFGGLAVLTYFYAVLWCGAGLGTLLNYTHTLWSNILAALWLRQKPVRGFWWALMLAALGLVLVLDPAAGHLAPWGIAIGLFSGLCGGAAVLTIKDLRRTDNALSINLALALGGLALSLPVALMSEAKTAASAPAGAWGWVALSGVFSFGGQYFFNHGFKGTSVARASLLALTTPVLACLSGWWWLQEALTPHFLAGALCILGACVWISWRESQAVALPV